MREKIISICFIITILAVPAITIYQNRASSGAEEVTGEEVQALQNAEKTAAADDKTAVAEEKEGIFDEFKKKITDYTGNMAFQEEAAGLNSQITSALADDNYIDSETVLAGKEGWLFYKCATDGTPLEDYQGTSVFTDAQMCNIKNSMLRKRDYFAARGQRFIVLMIPNKEIVYAKYMPDTIYRTSETTRYDKLYQYLKENTDLEVIYLKQQLMDATDQHQVYYKYDTHWNIKGVFVGIQSILQQLYGDSRSLDSMGIFASRTCSGDLARLIGMEEKYGDDPYYDFGEGAIDSSQKVSDSLLMIGDSFAAAMEPKIRYYFADVQCIDVQEYDEEMVKSSEAEIVIWECVERYADRFLWDLEP